VLSVRPNVIEASRSPWRHGPPVAPKRPRFPIKCALPAQQRTIHPAALVQTILFATAVGVARLAAARRTPRPVRRKRFARRDLPSVWGRSPAGSVRVGTTPRDPPPVEAMRVGLCGTACSGPAGKGFASRAAAGLPTVLPTPPYVNPCRRPSTGLEIVRALPKRPARETKRRRGADVRRKTAAAP
jgi:hypothetical protein